MCLEQPQNRHVSVKKVFLRESEDKTAFHSNVAWPAVDSLNKILSQHVVKNELEQMELF